jgi:hypothetical protein
MLEDFIITIFFLVYAGLVFIFLKIAVIDPSNDRRREYWRNQKKRKK